MNSAPQIKFGIAFNEASGPCLTRVDGNDGELRDAAREIAAAVGAGHFFAVVMREAFPINTLKAIQAAPEVCGIFCATANPVEVIVAETEQGRACWAWLTVLRQKAWRRPKIKGAATSSFEKSATNAD